jgi:uncharacterized protein
MPEDAVTPPVQPSAPPPATQPTNENQVRMWNMLCHLSALSGFLVPFGTIIGPLLVWQIKKNEFPTVEAHGKAALNFQLTILIAVVVGGAAAVMLSFFCIGFLFVPVVLGIALCGIIFPIIAGLKANDGKDYRYPCSLNLIK